eukprot:351408-Chlamydomonas_euryale.AAC.3
MGPSRVLAHFHNPQKFISIHVLSASAPHEGMLRQCESAKLHTLSLQAIHSHCRQHTLTAGNTLTLPAIHSHCRQYKTSCHAEALPWALALIVP